MTHPTWRRLGPLLVGVPTLLLFSSGVALAHVTVDPTTAVSGSETTFTFRVPTEKEHASTVKIVLALPTTTPIPVVSLKPVSGWTADVTTRKLAKPVQTDDGPVSTAVSRLTWTSRAKASAIAPGQFQEFTIEAGPLPKVKRLMFRVLQYYSDGSVVRWIDPPAAGGEPEHPAPAVTLDAQPNPAPPANGSSAEPDAASGDGWITVSAFIAGLLGLAAGTAALVAVRRSRSDGAS